MHIPCIFFEALERTMKSIAVMHWAMKKRTPESSRQYLYQNIKNDTEKEQII
jgi:hypothetical protein